MQAYDELKAAQAQIIEKEKLEAELNVARQIQQSLLPKEAPILAGWQVAAYYQPARAVGGDFYDFTFFPDGQLGLVIGDVSDKGVPAALVMATTRAILRGAAQRLLSPGQVLERVNEVLCPEIPLHMFVTCLYAILDPASGRLRYANAGHDLPYRRGDGGVSELRATGMPLGLMPDMRYEEKETVLAAGETVLFYSDGLVEAHNPERAMFGFRRLMGLMGQHPGGAGLIDALRGALAEFTGPDWEQEDDITLVILERRTSPPGPRSGSERGSEGERLADTWRTLAEFTLPSEPGNERQAMDRVAQAAQGLHLLDLRLERLKTAVAEATMNAMEHGNRYRPDVPVTIHVLVSDQALAVRITDQGGGQPIPEPQTPDLPAKLAGQQSPRGWGLFLIRNMVDDMRITTDSTHHTIELIFHLKGDEDAHATV
jgi:anti-sigma regulatory factor (Ser/Thr protein kinase)